MDIICLSGALLTTSVQTVAPRMRQQYGGSNMCEVNQILYIVFRMTFILKDNPVTVANCDS